MPHPVFLQTTESNLACPQKLLILRNAGATGYTRHYNQKMSFQTFFAMINI